MAKAKLNRALTSVSGTLDGYVFRKFKGGTILCKKPSFEGVTWSPAQQRNRERLRLATVYAKAVWADPVRKAFYEEIARARKAWRVYPLITADYMNPPQICRIEVATKSGNLFFVIHAIDDIEVVRVDVTIRDRDGVPIVSAAASKARDGRWHYQVPATGIPAADGSVEICAFDRPENRAVATRPLR